LRRSRSRFASSGSFAPRGLSARNAVYTGAFGFVAHDGGVTLAMGIRTVVLAGREGEYLTGGGIVADSDPARELEETRWKALQLERAATGA
jgi:anthranilate synthase component 1